MKWLKDFNNRLIRLTSEREKHIVNDHPEMINQIVNINETLLNPDIIIQSKNDSSVELFYSYYARSPVGKKHLCVTIKTGTIDAFILTAYFTDTIKKGDLIWKKK